MAQVFCARPHGLRQNLGSRCHAAWVSSWPAEDSVNALKIFFFALWVPATAYLATSMSAVLSSRDTLTPKSCSTAFSIEMPSRPSPKNFKY